MYFDKFLFIVRKYTRVNVLALNMRKENANFWSHSESMHIHLSSETVTHDSFVATQIIGCPGKSDRV